MTVPIIALPNLQTPVPPAQAAVLTTAPSDAAIGRLPVFAVPASVNMPEVYNNTYGGGGSAYSPAQSQSAKETPPFFPSVGSFARPVMRSGASSTFLAQLFGQHADAEPFITDGGKNVGKDGSKSGADILRRETVERFSNVKYLPSGAAKPRFSSSPTQPFVEVKQSQPDNVQSEMRRVLEVQQNNLGQEIKTPSAAASARRGAQQTGVMAPQVSASISAKPTGNAGTSTKEKGQQSRTSDSSSKPLTVGQGINAYLATVSRNAANLNSPSAAAISSFS